MAGPKFNNNKKKVSNFFTLGIQQGGENFLEFKNARDLELDAIRIFRQLARGQIDINIHGHYFLNSTLLNACIQSAYAKLVLYTVSYNGVNLLQESLIGQGIVPDPNIIMVLDNHKKCKEAYTIILNNLTYIKDTNNVNYVFCIIDSLSAYRNYV